MKKAYKVLLPKLGVVPVLPLPYRYCSKRYFGLGLPNLHLEKLIEKLTLVVTHYSANSQPGKHLRHAHEELQFELGMGTPFLHLSYSCYGKHLCPSWWRDLWESSTYYPITFQLKRSPQLPLQRKNDAYIMEHIINLGIYNTSELQLINQARFHYKCYSYADIYDITGERIRSRYLQTSSPPPPSTITTWPRTNPSSQSFSL